MAAVAIAVLAHAVFATATVFVGRWLDYRRTERTVERRLQILASIRTVARGGSPSEPQGNTEEGPR